MSHIACLCVQVYSWEHLFLFVGQQVWTPLCLVLWLHFIKLDSPAALCRATSDSWIMSHAFVTTSSQSTSARTILVRSLHTLEIFTLFAICTQRCGETDQGHKTTNIISIFLLLASLFHCVLINQHRSSSTDSMLSPSSSVDVSIISLQVLPHLFRKQWMPTSRN